MDGRVEEKVKRNDDLVFMFVVMALLGWASAFVNAYFMRRKVRIFRDGTFVLADSALTVDVFQKDSFGRATSLFKLGKAWMILKLHLNVLYLVRIPSHPGLMIMQLAPKVVPWHVDGKMVVCYLPSHPEQAVLVPNDIGIRMAATS